ncbi:MAG: SRPBCC domain-containing protein [Propionibacteriaceae bacterium]|nr:SRPBCC domain-containing protein [Propionibacteriaceae bacterium]
MTDQNLSEPASQPQDATVVVSRTVAFPVRQVWRVLMTKDGAEAMLGPGAQFGEKGHSWVAENGRTGVMRSLHPLEEIRFSYRRDEQAAPTTVELALQAEEDATVLTVTHSKLEPDMDLDDLRTRWQAALDRVADHLAQL